MASNTEHFQQAEKNYRLLRHLATNADTRSFHDWQVTVCFYIAVHLTNVFLADEGVHESTHSKTLNELVKRKSSSSNWQNLYDFYYNLKELSQKARYLNPIAKDNPPKLPSGKPDLKNAYKVNPFDLEDALTELNNLINLFDRLQNQNTITYDLNEFNIPINFSVDLGGKRVPNFSIGNRFIISYQ